MKLYVVNICLLNNIVQDLDKCIDHTLKQYDSNNTIIKRKGDKDSILACKTIGELLKLRKKLGLMEWNNPEKKSKSG